MAAPPPTYLLDPKAYSRTREEGGRNQTRVYRCRMSTSRLLTVHLKPYSGPALRRPQLLYLPNPLRMLLTRLPDHPLPSLRPPLVSMIMPGLPDQVLPSRLLAPRRHRIALHPLLRRRHLRQPPALQHQPLPQLSLQPLRLLHRRQLLNRRRRVLRRRQSLISLNSLHVSVVCERRLRLCLLPSRKWPQRSLRPLLFRLPRVSM